VLTSEQIEIGRVRFKNGIKRADTEEHSDEHKSTHDDIQNERPEHASRDNERRVFHFFRDVDDGIRSFPLIISINFSKPDQHK
jgi:hypothetical protein